MLKETGMERFKTMKYVYDDIEEALQMAGKFTQMFKKEGIYSEHSIIGLRNGRYMVSFKVHEKEE